MKDIEKNCLVAYNRLFKDTAFNDPSFIKALTNETVCLFSFDMTNNQPDSDKTSLKCIFKKNDQDLKNSIIYDYICFLEFKNVTTKILSDTFTQYHYNYELIEKIIHSFYTIGHNYGLFKSIEPIHSCAIEDHFNQNSGIYKHSNTISPTVGKLTAIHFSNFLKTKKTANSLLNGRKITINYRFLISNGEIHPVAVLSIPVSMNDNYCMNIDIHPSSKETAEQQFTSFKNEFDQILLTRIDKILKKELQLSKDTVSSLSLEDKINYLNIAEMNSI